MPFIHFTSIIHAPVERVFDLTRSISLHKISMRHANEEATAGTTSGLIKEGETVTWQARHFYKTRRLQVRITEMKLYEFFEGVMVNGDFKSMTHRHFFKSIENGTLVIDELEFEIAFGFTGRILCRLFLTPYMKRLLLHRNNVIREYAETGKWKMILQR